ncbi:hypothetical protein GCM10009527_076530 [Actinomadura nitritigenes]
MNSEIPWKGLRTPAPGVAHLSIKHTEERCEHINLSDPSAARGVGPSVSSTNSHTTDTGRPTQRCRL